MKALIRNEGETITEGMGIPCIDWDTGHPLTNPKWFGGPYKLINDCVPPRDGEDIVQLEQPKVEEESVVDENDYVVIDGKKYSKEELRSLLE